MKKPGVPTLRSAQPIYLLRAVTFTGVFAAIGTSIIVATFASSATGLIETENGALTAGAAVVTATGASGGRAVRFSVAATPTPTATPAPTPTPTPTPAAGACTTYASNSTYASCGFPTASTAGIPAGTVLAAQETYGGAGLVVSVDNTVINARNIVGYLDIRASNVTVQNTQLTSNSWFAVKIAAGKTGFKFLHSKLLGAPANGTETDYGVATLGNDAFEVAYSDMSGVKEAVTGSAFNAHDNYVHDLRAYTGAHTQCIYVYSGGAGVTITHNTLLNNTGGTNTTAALYVAPDSANQNNHLIQNNWLSGGAYTAYGGDTNATNIRFLNNAFSTEVFPPNGSLYGPVSYWQAAGAGNVWTGNKWGNGTSANQVVTP